MQRLRRSSFAIRDGHTAAKRGAHDEFPVASAKDRRYAHYVAHALPGSGSERRDAPPRCRVRRRARAVTPPIFFTPQCGGRRLRSSVTFDTPFVVCYATPPYEPCCSLKWIVASHHDTRPRKAAGGRRCGAPPRGAPRVDAPRRHACYAAALMPYAAMFSVLCRCAEFFATRVIILFFDADMPFMPYFRRRDATFCRYVDISALLPLLSICRYGPSSPAPAHTFTR